MPKDCLKNYIDKDNDKMTKIIYQSEFLVTLKGVKLIVTLVQLSQ